ncbi:MAG: 4-hydroxy-3-methylbut-2-enyl diphosphate reductase [Marvinbryantia sp.]|jgi:4-hydroxy-3-methylbut-2-enyl diphosphate reductase
MKVRVAKTAGFCFGVKRAVDKVYEQTKKKGALIYTYGPIIHNEEVVRDLQEKGVMVLNTREELEMLTEGTVIIRSHGVGKEIYRLIEEKGLQLVDATCPFVKKIHRIVERESADGKRIVIIGNEYHPEVEGIMGWCHNHADVIETEEKAHDFHVGPDEKVCIVSQTTFNNNKFQNLVEIISKKGYDSTVINTICSATDERQAEAAQMAKQVGAMIVIGGRHSSNTQKLFDICNKECENTYFIQTLKDLEQKQLPPVDCVGITAGASTPNYIIKEVQRYVRDEF